MFTTGYPPHTFVGVTLDPSLIKEISMNVWFRAVGGALAMTLALALAAQPAQAQLSTSIGAGIAAPQGDLGDGFDNGYTVRGQVGLSLVGLVEGHVQAGWSRFPVKEGVVGGEDADIYHAGVGARVGLGLIFVGANAAYFFGDDPGDNSELGFFPEVGIGLGPLEAVADYRIDGDAKWFGIRAALKF